MEHILGLYVSINENNKIESVYINVFKNIFIIYKQMNLYLILFMFCNRNIRRLNNLRLQNELPCNNNASLHDTDDKEFLKGFDLRPIKKEEPPLEILIDLHEKNKRLIKLLSNDYSLLDKEKWAHEYLNRNKTMGVNVTKGGLMDDWNFII